MNMLAIVFCVCVCVCLCVFEAYSSFACLIQIGILVTPPNGIDLNSADNWGLLAPQEMGRIWRSLRAQIPARIDLESEAKKFELDSDESMNESMNDQKSLNQSHVRMVPLHGVVLLFVTFGHVVDFDLQLLPLFGWIPEINYACKQKNHS